MLTFDQKNCRYHPHVFGVRVGQAVEIVNSDPTLHNIHALPKDNAEFNNGQPIQGMKMTHTFTAKEVMVPFKCDVHGWMNAYVGVARSPVLRGHRQGRQVLLQGPAARDLHHRGVAREARHADGRPSPSARRKPRTRTSRSRQPRPPTNEPWQAVAWQVRSRAVGSALRRRPTGPPDLPDLSASEFQPSPFRHIRRRLHGAARPRRESRHEHRLGALRSRLADLVRLEHVLVPAVEMGGRHPLRARPPSRSPARWAS